MNRKFMNRTIGIFLALIMLFSFVACGKSDRKGNVAKGEKFKVILLIPGNLGDKSFFDAANAGITELNKIGDYETKVVEMTADESKWEPALLDAIDGGYDLIISGNGSSDIMNKLAKENKDLKFFNFDNAGTDAPENVYSVSYATNEGSFLAGVFASLVTTNTELKLANKNKTIGFMGGMDIPGINDFLVGYIQGAQHIDPEIKIVTTYAGSFGDPAKGKELSLGMYNIGVDISFNVAGQTGLGSIDAANETKKYAIGVDSDQAMLYKDSEPEKAQKVLTSVVKNIDKVIVDSVQKAKEGKLEYGKHELLGLKDDAVGLSDNEIYQTVPENIRKKLEEVKDEILSEKIKVKSAFKMSTDEIAKYRESVQPK
ncbi:BMP family ABC transporter substrate-binding protein [Helcococcus kunzii]|uniref:BMP family ABC transporter substrate-binding protein n=1 Tax=Helcococcus kunzii TaxID=40091 RepID=UPI0024AE64FA|nr:BMP family ABC transporter substrate-binding protein [Helcococcus kunzii]